MRHFLPSALRQTWNTSLVFIKEWVRSPRTVGMVCPSGPSLARAMAAGVPKHVDGLVVELGAGTGTVTSELLRAGLAAEKLIVIEQSPRMVQLLKRRFPQLTIIQGDASHLPALLPPEQPIRCIVSSLPLLSLSEQVRQALIQAMFTSLAVGGILLQYTYAWKYSNGFRQRGFVCIGSRTVWKNVPPARIFRFERKK